MRTLYIDTASTHFWDFNLPDGDTKQPDLLRLAFWSDAWLPAARPVVFVFMAHHPIATIAISAHGIRPDSIRPDRADDLRESLGELSRELHTTDRVVMFAAAIHRKVLNRTAAGFEMPLPWPEKEKVVDAMIKAAPVVGLRTERGKSKWPTLREAIAFFRPARPGHEPIGDPLSDGARQIEAIREVWVKTEAASGATSPVF